MKNEIEVFKNKEFGEIRTVEVDGKPYFVASDIAKALGYAIPSKAVNTHCKGVSKMEAPSNGGKQETLIIPEGDVYRLITHSKLPSAEKFESWCLHDRGHAGTSTNFSRFPYPISNEIKGRKRKESISYETNRGTSQGD